LMSAYVDVSLGGTGHACNWYVAADFIGCAVPCHHEHDSDNDDDIFSKFNHVTIVIIITATIITIITIIIIVVIITGAREDSS